MSEPRAYRNRTAYDLLPKDGKLVIAAPSVAASMAEQAPEYADRIYTSPYIDPTKAYVVDLDVLLAPPRLDYERYRP